MTTRNEALAMVRSNTRGTCCPWELAGPHFKKIRQKIMHGLTGEKLPIAKCGVTAIERTLIDISKVEGNCAAVREKNLAEWIKAETARA